jgi:MFS family permease
MPPTEHTRRHARLRSNPWLIFAVVGLGGFLGPLSGSIVNVALPSIGSFFHADVQSAKWVVMVYLVVGTSLIPLAGKLGQRFGEGRLYSSGLAIYILASTACALTAYAPRRSLLLLVIARAMQSSGSSMMFATGGALVTKYIPPERRGIAFGLVGSTVAMALISGPVLGGLICAFSSWPWIFWIVAIVAAAGYVASRIMLPREGAPQTAVALPAWSGLAWFALIVCLTLIGEAFSKGLWVDHLWLTGLLAVSMLALFILAERRGPSLFDYSMFRITALRMGAQGAVMVNVIVFIVTLLMPFYLEVYLGVPLARIGMLLGAAPLCSMFFGPVAGHLADKWGYRPPIITGLATISAAYALLIVATEHASLWQIAAGLALIGAGSGMYGAPNFAAIMGSVSPHQRPLASSLGSLTRNVGFLASTSLGSIALGTFLAHYGGQGLMFAARTEVLTPQVVPQAAFVYAFSHVLMLCAVLAVCGMLLSLRFPNRPDAAIVQHAGSGQPAQ